MPHFTRREWLSVAAISCLPTVARGNSAAKSPLGYSLYNLKSLALPDALKLCRECGYDGVELALMPGYHADPAKLSAADVKELGKRITDSGLAVHGLMENLPALGDDAAHKSNLNRLKAAADLANALVPNAPPPIETVLGGKPAEWDKVKDKLATRLTAWAAIAKAAKTVVAVKPHVANALHAPEGTLWLLKQVNNEFLRLAFDYSHYALRGVKLDDAVAGLVPHSVFVHVKDARGTPEKFEFLLPGEGTVNYPEYAKLLEKAKYSGPVVVEVSAMISNKPGYDPAAAARASYRSLSASFGRAAKE